MTPLLLSCAGHPLLLGDVEVEVADASSTVIVATSMCTASPSPGLSIHSSKQRMKSLRAINGTVNAREEARWAMRRGCWLRGTV